MSFLNIKDPAKRDFLIQEYSKMKQNIDQDSLAERMGDIGMRRELTKLYKLITESQATQSAALTKALSNLKESTTAALQALPASLASLIPPQLEAVQFPHYPSTQADADEVSTYTVE